MNQSQIRNVVLSGAATIALLSTAPASQDPQVPVKSKPAVAEQPVQTPGAAQKPESAPKQGKSGKQVKKAGTISGGTVQGKRKRRAPPTTEQLVQRYEEALKDPFIAKGNWVLDYDEARARAKREGKLIFAYFSRSYAP